MSASPFRLAFLLLATISSLPAAEVRTWTSTDGRTLQATLISQNGSNVTLKLAEGRTVEIPLARLSPADRAYLEKLPPPTSPAASLSSGKDVALDPKLFVKREQPFEFCGLKFDALETPHFLILSKGRHRPAQTAEHAERLWHHLAALYPNFAPRWSTRYRFVILLLSEKRD